jgi:two-component system chemotaxis response regulator CheY
MGKRIMTVDDSPTFRKVLGHSLRGAGYEVVEAVDGKEALVKLETAPVDMVITDLTMPGMNGIELVREIRSLYESVPVVMLSTVGEEKSLEEGRAAGVTGWIVKPFDPRELLSVIGQLLQC